MDALVQCGGRGPRGCRERCEEWAQASDRRTALWHSLQYDGSGHTNIFYYFTKSYINHQEFLLTLIHTLWALDYFYVLFVFCSVSLAQGLRVTFAQVLHRPHLHHRRP